jgi:hypothetical protein
LLERSGQTHSARFWENRALTAESTNSELTMQLKRKEAEHAAEIQNLHDAMEIMGIDSALAKAKKTEYVTFAFRQHTC